MIRRPSGDNSEEDAGDGRSNAWSLNIEDFFGVLCAKFSFPISQWINN